MGTVVVSHHSFLIELIFLGDLLILRLTQLDFRLPKLLRGAHIKRRVQSRSFALDQESYVLVRLSSNPRIVKLPNELIHSLSPLPVNPVNLHILLFDLVHAVVKTEVVGGQTYKVLIIFMPNINDWHAIFFSFRYQQVAHRVATSRLHLLVRLISVVPLHFQLWAKLASGLLFLRRV